MTDLEAVYQRIADRAMKRKAERLARPMAKKAGKKQCCRCRDFQPFVDFSRDRSSGDGRTSECKGCRQVRYRERTRVGKGE